MHNKDQIIMIEEITKVYTNGIAKQAPWDVG